MKQKRPKEACLHAYTMNGWDTTLDNIYLQYDPTLSKTEDEIDVFMGRHIDDILNSREELMFDHEFVTAALGFLSSKKGRVFFSDYAERVRNDEQFALDAVKENSGLLLSFDLTNSENYSAICEASVKRSWRHFKSVDVSRCDRMLKISIIALKGALEIAQKRFSNSRPNAFVLTQVLDNILPVAMASGLSEEDAGNWKNEFEKIRVGK